MKLLTALSLLLMCTQPLHLTVKSNDVPLTEVEQVVPTLAEEDASLYLKVQREDLTTDLLSLLSSCAQDDVHVTLWPLLPDSLGPWCNEQNITAFTGLVDTVILYTDAHKVDAIAVNVENSLEQMTKIRYLIKSHSYSKLIEVLLANKDPQWYQESLEAFKALCGLIQSSGAKAVCTTYPFLMDDYRDKDNDLQDVCNTPIKGIPWDNVVYTTYRTSYSKDFMCSFSPYFVYSYALTAKALGHNVAIGVTDDYSIGDFALDIRAARAAGQEEVHVHRLKTVNAEWLKLREADAYIPTTDHKVIAFRAFTDALDRALDEADHEALKELFIEFSIEMRNMYE